MLKENEKKKDSKQFQSRKKKDLICKMCFVFFYIKQIEQKISFKSLNKQKKKTYLALQIICKKNVIHRRTDVRKRFLFCLSFFFFSYFLFPHSDSS